MLKSGKSFLFCGLSADKVCYATRHDIGPSNTNTITITIMVMRRLSDGRLPLHVAIQKHDATGGVNMCTWKQIFQCYPCAIRAQDRENLYPFMLASAYSDVGVAYELLRMAPDVIWDGNPLAAV